MKLTGAINGSDQRTRSTDAINGRDGRCRNFSIFKRLSNAAHQFWTSRISTAEDYRSTLAALLQWSGEARGARRKPIGGTLLPIGVEA
jgi:hypothetical protein